MITENEIDSKLQKLQGEVPNVLIKDLKNKLVSKIDILTPEQVDLIINKVLENYSSQAERLRRLDKRVEEIGKYLEEIRRHLMDKTTLHKEFNEKSERVPERIPEVEHQEGIKSYDPPKIELIENNMSGEEEILTEEFQIPKDVREALINPTKMRARLDHLPNDTASTMIALKWLGFLIDRAGVLNLENILEFYYTIGWISEEVLESLLKYANGTRPHQREPNWKPDDKLTIQDHLISLLFIERLRGTKITPEVLNSLERELKMMNKILEHVYGV
ncbi:MULTISPECIES: FlaD/FlaE family flagellar protein [Thermococcus]|uniref:Flagella-related protein d, putative n=2 Tax=Thermococcus sibiricus TaxID=172049 RepID=C6A2K0_THESM|nr:MULTISPECIES: FlaD/FlaE family flagellar protein [Thermococcus]KUK28320.1 MAG: Flagella-related protein d, putative [Thermococcus sp. 40_45]HII66728.1 flagellar protein [Thermococcaceae archaeon]ACS89845.1 Flagella-related protein d, putative [Thermococcus sibiricus MM 739]KUK18223.1 MAG: Flagella-related protein d, putative [Thermococcus sibiricus]MBC7095061.1 flagellar protein [Thermococcus sp.]